jgi:hypothetical protein
MAIRHLVKTNPKQSQSKPILMSPMGHLVGCYIFPQAFFLAFSGGFQLFVFIVRTVLKARIGISEAFFQQSFIEKPAVRQFNIGQQSAVFAPRVIAFVEIDSYLPL